MPLINQEGTFVVTVQTVALTESKNGSPCVEMLFQTASGEHITGWLYLTEKTIERTVNTLRNVFRFNDDFGSLESQIKGKACSIVVEYETDNNGKARLRVQWVNTVSREARPIASTNAAQLTALARCVPRQVAATPAARAPQPRQAPPVTATVPSRFDDDVPF